jgi:20S proteasome subunit alpha 3
VHPLLDCARSRSARAPRRAALPPVRRAPRSPRLPRRARDLAPALAPSAGRIFQIEYAIAAIQNAAACVGIQTAEGIVIASEKKVFSKLLAPLSGSEKTYKLAEHVFVAVAGLTSDASVLVDYGRLAAARYEFTYAEPQPVEGLVQLLCDHKHSYTQHGGLRPFGVAFLYAGWDRHHGFQLYQSDPSGNYRCGAGAARRALCALLRRL